MTREEMDSSILSMADNGIECNDLCDTLGNGWGINKRIEALRTDSGKYQAVLLAYWKARNLSKVYLVPR